MHGHGERLARSRRLVHLQIDDGGEGVCEADSSIPPSSICTHLQRLAREKDGVGRDDVAELHLHSAKRGGAWEVSSK